MFWLCQLYIPGVENWQMDFLSHPQLILGEWAFHPEVFSAICQHCVKADVDLLVPRFLMKSYRYVYGTRNSQAIGMDALVTWWDQFSPSLSLPTNSVSSMSVTQNPRGKSGSNFNNTSWAQEGMVSRHLEHGGGHPLTTSGCSRPSVSGSIIASCFTV